MVFRTREDIIPIFVSVPVRGKGSLALLYDYLLSDRLFNVSVPVRGKGSLAPYPMETLTIFSFQGAVAPMYGRSDVI